MSRLELRQEQGGLRLYLEGVPLHAGDGVDRRFPDGQWIEGRYEYSIGFAGPGRSLHAFFYFPFHGEQCLVDLGIWRLDQELDERPLHQLRLPGGDR